MSEKAEYKSAIRSRRLIREAFIELIQEKDIEKMFEFLRQFHHKNFFQNPLPLLLKISSWLEDDLEFYRILINSRGSEDFLIKLKELLVDYMKTNSDFPEHAKRSPQFSIHAHFFAGGIINLYEVWLRGEIDSSLKEISQEISMIFINYSNLFCLGK